MRGPCEPVICCVCIASSFFSSAPRTTFRRGKKKEARFVESLPRNLHKSDKKRRETLKNPSVNRFRTSGSFFSTIANHSRLRQPCFQSMSSCWRRIRRKKTIKTSSKKFFLCQLSRLRDRKTPFGCYPLRLEATQTEARLKLKDTRVMLSFL